jgi:hypothetical protein
MPPAIRRNAIRTFQRTTSTALSLYETGGWTNSTLNDLEFTFSLQNTYQYVGGILTATVTNPGYADFVPLFERWRIREIQCMVAFSNNNSSINSPASTLPLLLTVIDYDDAAAITSTQALQYDNLMIFQLGNGATGPPIIRFKPKAQSQVYAGTTAYAVAPEGQWFNTDYPTTPHYGLKFVYDNSAGTSTVSIGYVTFYFRYTLEFDESN